jgi:preprotein translocase subunit SecG
MQLAKVRLIVWLIVAVAIVTFVLMSSKKAATIEFSAFGGLKQMSARSVVLIALAAGFVLGWLFRVTRPRHRKSPETKP